MAIYSYRCQKCSLDFDALEPMDAPRARSCESPTCDGTADRVPSVPAPAQFRCSMPTYQKPAK